MVACALLAASLLTSIFTAPPAAAESSIEATVGYGGYVLLGRSFPVAVSVTTDRLIRGRIDVSARPLGGGSEDILVSLPVEVPGGGAKKYLVTLPPGQWFPGQPVNVQARLRDGDGDVVDDSASQSLRIADDRELVGLLPGATTSSDLPPPTPLAVEGGVANFFAIGDAELAQAPMSLEPLGTIAVGPDEVGTLAPDARRGLLAWLERGGTLLVGAPPGAAVAGIPDAWQPGSSSAHSAGLGRIRMVGNQVRDGQWAGLVYPTPSASVADMRFGPFGAPVSTGSALANDAGLRVPRLGWLLLFLIAYAAIVGPLTAIVLGRVRRTELAWVVIPAVALVFTAGTWAVAKGLRASTGTAYAEVVESSPAGARATTFVGIAARGRTNTSVTSAGRTWTARQHSSGNGPSSANIALGPNGPEASLRLASGQFGVVNVAGPTDELPGLEVTASSGSDGEASGSIVNASGGPLDDVVVFVGTRATQLGRLGAGEERTWTIIGGEGPRDGRDPFRLIDASVWDEASGMGRPIDADSAVNYPAWIESTPLAGVSRPSGVAVAVGWTRDRAASARIGGKARPTSGRTALVSSAPVVPTAAITDMTVRGQAMRGGFDGGPRVLGAGDVSLSQILRFVLPDGHTPQADLIARVPMAGRVEVWDGRRWTDSGAANPLNIGNDPFAGLEVPVPRGSVVDGQVFLRVLNLGGPMITGAMTLSERQ